MNLNERLHYVTLSSNYPHSPSPYPPTSPAPPSQPVRQPPSQLATPSFLPSCPLTLVRPLIPLLPPPPITLPFPSLPYSSPRSPSSSSSLPLSSLPSPSYPIQLPQHLSSLTHPNLPIYFISSLSSFKLAGTFLFISYSFLFPPPNFFFNLHNPLLHFLTPIFFHPKLSNPLSSTVHLLFFLYFISLPLHINSLPSFFPSFTTCQHHNLPQPHALYTNTPSHQHYITTSFLTLMTFCPFKAQHTTHTTQSTTTQHQANPQVTPTKSRFRWPRFLPSGGAYTREESRGASRYIAGLGFLSWGSSSYP